MAYRYKKLKMPDGSTIDEHRFVMQNHLGRKLARNEVVHHINGNKMDNRLENLQVMDLSSHSKLHYDGIICKDPEKRKILSRKSRTLAKLSINQIGEIRDLINNKVEVYEIANMYNVHKTTIYRIKNNESWHWTQQN